MKIAIQKKSSLNSLDQPNTTSTASTVQKSVTLPNTELSCFDAARSLKRTYIRIPDISLKNPASKLCPPLRSNRSEKTPEE